MNQFLTFNLEDEIFAFDISHVREVLEMMAVTKVPKTPKFVRGVLNLRGLVMPVIDMRCKFQMNSVEDTIDTCIIVLEISIDDELIVVGAVVDAVREVIELLAKDMQPTPKIGTPLDTEFISCMARVENDIVIVLDIRTIFSVKEIGVTQSIVRDNRGFANHGEHGEHAEHGNQPPEIPSFGY